MDEMDIELKRDFLGESQQLLQDAEQCFLQIESEPDNPDVINTLFRLAHNLKGSANAVGFMDLGSFTHKLESLLLKIKDKKASVTGKVVTLLLACKDQIQLSLDKLKIDLSASVDYSQLSSELDAALTGQDVSTTTEAVVAAVTVDVAEEIAAEVETQESEPEQTEPEQTIVAEAFVAQPQTENKAFTPEVDENIRVSLARLDKLINYVGEIVILQTVLAEQAFLGNLHMVQRTSQQLGKVTRELQDISMSLRMVPMKQTFLKMQRIVRDTSYTLNKKVQLHVKGEETELEKTVLELIGDPLVHLIRNAVDHGIDSTEEREAAGKPEVGKVFLQAYHRADNIVIEVKDDGKGIDAQKLRKKAIEKGIMREQQVISDKAALNLIFHPGFSTKDEVTDVSGRGVGLDVVKTNIERLQGSIDVMTELGKGTTFKIQLPLTLAIIEATTIKLAGQRYAIPMSHIHESVQIDKNNLHYSVNSGEIYYLRNENLPTFRLTALLGLKSMPEQKDDILLVIRVDEMPFGVIVNDISAVQQIVIKKLGRELAYLDGYTGSAILGDGRPALILNLPQIVQKHSVRRNVLSTTNQRLSA